MTQFQNKYRIETTRWKDWNYSQSGMYFITICTQGMRCCLGRIVAADVELSPWGTIVREEWLRTPKVRPNVTLDEWVIMPNHLHCILAITNEPKDTSVPVETHSCASLQTQDRFGPRRRNLAAAIRGFKATAARRIRLSGFREFAWQARYYEHVIQSEKALDGIREYILCNPMKWEFDKENPEGVFC